MERLARALPRIAGTFFRPTRPDTPAAPAAPAHAAVNTGWLQLLRSLREIPELAHRNPTSTGYIRYRAAQAGRAPELHLTQWVPLHDISPYMVCSLIRAEDPVFFWHQGIGWPRIRKAIRTALRERKPVRAVSTITQQLARNLFLHPDRSMKRKLQEAILARRLEQVLTKERILELYLNVVEWGEGIWGIGSAAREHFSRTPAELDAFQSVVLASMLPAPRRPLRDGNAKRALTAQKSAGIILYGCGILSRDEKDQFKSRVLELERAIEEGIPAEDVLRASTERPFVLTLEDRPDISVRSLMESGCGRRLWRGLVPVLREAGQQQRSPELPLWWTSEVTPEPVEQGAA